MQEIIRNQKPVTMLPTVTVQEACKAMHAHNIGAILITDDTGRLLGIFTGRDAVRVLGHGTNTGSTLLQEVMTKNPDTMKPHAHAIDALRLMRDGGFRHIPVVDEGRLVGIVSRGDFRGLEHDRLDVETGLWERIG
jgi:CBS domain-containing protein